MSSDRLTPSAVAPAVGRASSIVALALLLVSSGRAAAPQFYPDDPIQVDDDRALDAGSVEPVEGSNAYDFAEHTLF